jgi:hypothetical protein
MLFILLTLMNTSAMNIHVQVLGWTYFISLRYILWSEIAESYGHSIINIFRNGQTDFHFRFSRQCRRVSISQILIVVVCMSVFNL